MQKSSSRRTAASSSSTTRIRSSAAAGGSGGGGIFQQFALHQQDLKKDDDSNYSRDRSVSVSSDDDDDNAFVVDSIDPSAINPMSGIKRKNVRKPMSAMSALNFVLSFVLLTLIVIASFLYLQSWQSKQEVKIRRQIEDNQVAPLSKQWEEQFVQLKETQDKLKKLQEEVKEHSPQHEKLQKRSDYLEKYRLRMHQAIQHMSKVALIEKFGPGPHFVEIQFAIDPESNIYDAAKDATPGGDEEVDDDHKVIIEMASVEDMPHTVYTFLQQVHQGLHNGCSLHRNAGHVLQGGPAPNFLTPPDFHLATRFTQSGFESVLFQEYSPHHPHVKYTLGYAGRPGGPDWYISIQDNSRIHGPGGQDSYEDPTEADPCFAKVVKGFDLVDRIALSKVKPGDYKRMEHYVAIKSMKIIKDKDDETQQKHKKKRHHAHVAKEDHSSSRRIAGGSGKTLKKKRHGSHHVTTTDKEPAAAVIHAAEEEEQLQGEDARPEEDGGNPSVGAAPGEDAREEEEVEDADAGGDGNGEEYDAQTGDSTEE